MQSIDKQLVTPPIRITDTHDKMSARKRVRTVEHGNAIASASVVHGSDKARRTETPLSSKYTGNRFVWIYHLVSTDALICSFAQLSTLIRSHQCV